MAEKDQQSQYPTAPSANGYARSSDTEAAASHGARVLRKNERTKCFLNINLPFFLSSSFFYENQMAETDQQSQYPTAPSANCYALSSDTEAAAAQDARELRKKKRTRCFLYIVLFVIFQIAIITLFALTVMKIRTPKFRVCEATLSNFNNGGTQANPSLTAKVNAVLSVKNTNFGRYKYWNTKVVFSYRGTPVGEVSVPNSRANWRSTKKFNVALNLNLANPQLSNDLSTGIVKITSQAKMRGRVELMFVVKKNRSTDMDCTMDIALATQQISNIVCK